MHDVWKDKNYSGQIKKVFIIGVSQDNKMRKQFENEYVKQLAIKKIEAIPSHTVLSSDKILDKNTIVSKIKDMDIDGVIVTKLIEKTKKSYAGSSFQGENYYTYYVDSFHFAESYKATQADYVTLETNLYDAKSEKLIWSGLSETFIYRTTSESIKPFIESMIQNLSNDNMI
jgi:ABC-type branched-subunit amino acid transport system substrate-binding protein